MNKKKYIILLLLSFLLPWPESWCYFIIGLSQANVVWGAVALVVFVVALAAWAVCAAGVAFPVMLFAVALYWLPAWPPISFW